LFHGIYKEQPVAVKFIRQPDDEEDAELAAQLEKQFNTEVTTLSRLHHPNVIKVTHNFPFFKNFFCGYDAGVILHWL
jgi:serine/threonine protein kinase